MLIGCEQQWISEVLHFCQGLPIILVGCKKDLRYDGKTIEELRKTSQKPVSPEEVRHYTALLPPAGYTAPPPAPLSPPRPSNQVVHCDHVDA